MMIGNNRADAVYAVVSTQSNFQKLTAAEASLVQQNLRIVYGADLAYIVSNATILPGSMYDPAGAQVSTTGSAVAQTGSVTSAQGIMGTGTIS